MSPGTFIAKSSASPAEDTPAQKTSDFNEAFAYWNVLGVKKRGATDVPSEILQ
jgi:hypothetical protein